MGAAGPLWPAGLPGTLSHSPGLTRTLVPAGSHPGQRQGVLPGLQMKARGWVCSGPRSQGLRLWGGASPAPVTRGYKEDGGPAGGGRHFTAITPRDLQRGKP